MYNGFIMCVPSWPMVSLAGLGAAAYHCFEFWSGKYARLWAAPVKIAQVSGDEEGMTSSNPGSGFKTPERYLLELGTRAFPSSSNTGNSSSSSSSGSRNKEDYQSTKIPSHGAHLYSLRPVAYARDTLSSGATVVRTLPALVGSDVHFRCICVCHGRYNIRLWI